MSRDGAVVLVGAPGAGKSSVLEALSGLLADAGTEHAAIELEQLAAGHPWLAFGDTLPQLEAVLDVQHGLGRRLFLLTATTETDDDLERLVARIGEPVLVVALRVRPETAAARVLEREPADWSGRSRLADNAQRLALGIPGLRRVDVALDTEAAAPREVARSIRQLLAERGWSEPA